MRRGQLLAERGIFFIDAGVSGGIWGLQEGFCLMVGGEPEKVAVMQPIFDALAPEGGFVHCGPVGAGHFTKMVHNGIEYGMMQAYAEGFELLGASELDINTTAVVTAWGYGSVIRSWLLELLAARPGRRPDPGAGAGLRGGLGRGPVDGAGGGAPGRAGQRAVGVAVRPVHVPPGRLPGHEGAGPPPPRLRRPRGKSAGASPD